MAVRKIIPEKDGIYFVTITCYKWLNLFSITEGFDIVYTWFDYLKDQGHFINAYIIMPNHLHVLFTFRKSNKSINQIIGNGKRLMAYQLVHHLERLNRQDVLKILKSGVNKSDQKKGKLHQVFQPSFDWKECINDHFIYQKLNYIHQNPMNLVDNITDYKHSSARFYENGKQGLYTVTSVEEIKDIDLTKPW